MYGYSQQTTDMLAEQWHRSRALVDSGYFNPRLRDTFPKRRRYTWSDVRWALAIGVFLLVIRII